MNMPTPYGSLATHLAAVQQRMGAPRLASFGATPPRLIAASKTQPVAMLEAAIALGITDFGENRVQEAQEKWPALKEKYPHIRLHLIGPLQSNKAGEAVALFDVIQTLDRPSIIAALAKEMQKQGRHPALLMQVNTGEETQKAGIAPQALPALLAEAAEHGLIVGGLMCVPPHDQHPAPHFALLRKLARRHQLTELSMGMSDDLDIAIRMGATMVRVGTALFGLRGGT